MSHVSFFDSRGAITEKSVPDRLEWRKLAEWRSAALNPIRMREHRENRLRLRAPMLRHWDIEFWGVVIGGVATRSLSAVVRDLY
jgi:hypothetical protein